MRAFRVLAVAALFALSLFAFTGRASATTYPIVVTAHGSVSPIVTQFVTQLETTLRSKDYAANVTEGAGGVPNTINFRVTDQVIDDAHVAITVVTIVTSADGTNVWYASTVNLVSATSDSTYYSVADAVQNVVSNAEHYLGVS